MRKPALDALCTMFYGLAGGWTQQYMKMFRHNRKTEQQVAYLIAVMKEGLHHEFCIGGSHEETAPWVRSRCERIGVHTTR